MIDAGIHGGSWVEIPAKKYELITTNKITSAQIELHVLYVGSRPVFLLVPFWESFGDI